jgi:hypothetical protein
MGSNLRSFGGTPGHLLKVELAIANRTVAFKVTSELAVIHPEPVQEAIRIPPAPDASASTPPARAPAPAAVRTLIVRPMSYCTEEAYFLNHSPSCDDSALGEAKIRAGANVQRSGNKNQESQNSHLTLTENPLPYGCGYVEHSICGFV